VDDPRRDEHSRERLPGDLVRPLQLASVAASTDLNTGFALETRAARRSSSMPQDKSWIRLRGVSKFPTQHRCDAGAWKLLRPPHAAPRIPPPRLLAVAQLRINEWAAALNGQADWSELYNPTHSPSPWPASI
jgi:hypothetical protein